MYHQVISVSDMNHFNTYDCSMFDIVENIAKQFTFYKKTKQKIKM